MNYMLCTGRYNVSDEWRQIWLKNSDRGQMRCTIEVGANMDCFYSEGFKTQKNLGHVHDLIPGMGKDLPYEFCGWSFGVITSACLAYVSGRDALYKEQDALAFGNWDEQMYADLGDGKMIFGRKMKGPPWMQCGQSLILIKHDFIPSFVSAYLSMGRDGDIHNLPERKFERLETRFGRNTIRRLSFGYDRERPINFDDKVWYAQKFTAEELAELKKRKMI